MRPKCYKRIEFSPRYKNFRPECRGRFDIIEISSEEAEALRLKNLERLDQTEAAKKMGISQSTSQRILSGAYHKVSESLIDGKALRIVDQK